MPNFDLALLILRVAAGTTLFLKHGVEKFNFAGMVPTFPDPIGIGAGPSLMIAFFSDVICALLVVCGLYVRAASVVIFCSVAVAWALVHSFQFYGEDHGEMIVYILSIFAALALTGGGRYSLDSIVKHWQQRKRGQLN